MRSKIFFVVACALAATTSFAESTRAQSARPLDPADVAALTGRSFSSAQPAPAPQGTEAAIPASPARRPLDWRDVDILTGKADREARARTNDASPYITLDPYMTGSYYARGTMSRIGRAAPPLFSPFGIRGVGRGSFFFGTRPFGGFLFGRGPRLHSFFFR